MIMQSLPIPTSLQPYFQEYDLADLRLRKDANLIIQRTLEYGTWADVRSGSITLTDFGFTGQRAETSLGLAFYVSRWYDSALGRFTSPDTIVPLESQGVQAWGRMSRVV